MSLSKNAQRTILKELIASLPTPPTPKEFMKAIKNYKGKA